MKLCTLAGAAALAMICSVAAEGAEGAAGGGGAAEAKAKATQDAPEAPSLAEPATLGFAKVKHPDGATSVSWGGQAFEADKAGKITVPLQAVADLTSHGFELVG